jgi:PPM family protein phosphatase
MNIRPGIELGNLTDVGCHRTHNEDYYCYAEPASDEEFGRKGRLIVIADGMGGHKGGQFASAIAVEAVRAAYLASDADSPDAALVGALQAAQQAIQDFAREHPELEGMGTTCIAAVLRGSELTYAHVGDSRLYLVRNAAITQLTQDQTVVNMLVQQGMLKAEEAANHPDRGVLTAALGIGDGVAAEVPEAPIALEPGDILLLCTDGLHDLVGDQELAAATASPPPAACQALIELAKSRGGFDNITVQILKFEGTS